MKENSAYKEVTLIKSMTWTGRTWKKGTKMMKSLDVARKMVADGDAKYTKVGTIKQEEKAIKPIDQQIKNS